MEAKEVQEKLWGQPSNDDLGRVYLSITCYILSTTENKIFCATLYAIKVSSGYRSILSNFLNMIELK